MRQEHAGGNIQAEIWHFEVIDYIFLRVSTDLARFQTRSVVQHDLWRTKVIAGLGESGTEVGVGDHIGGVGAHRGGRGGGNDERRILGKVGLGTRNESDMGEGVAGEEAGGMRANHRAGANDEEGPAGGIARGDLRRMVCLKVLRRLQCSEVL